MQSSPKLPGIPGTALLYLMLPYSLPFCWRMLCTPRNSAIFTPVPFAKFHMSTTQIEDYSSTYSLSILSFGEESKTCRKISLNAGYNILFSDVFLNQRTNFLTNITMLKRKTAIWQARKTYLPCVPVI